jgi:hypothetical protein
MAARSGHEPYEYDELLDRVERLQDAARELAHDLFSARERAREDFEESRKPRRYRR